jgi:hypothetical protein
MRYFVLGSLLLFVLWAPIPAQATEVLSSSGGTGWGSGPEFPDVESTTQLNLDDGVSVEALLGTFNPGDLPTGHASLFFGSDQFKVTFPDGSSLFDPPGASLVENFIFNPITVPSLRVPFTPASDSSPFQMTGTLNIPGVLSTDLMGRGTLTAVSFEDPPPVGINLVVGFLFDPNVSLPEPSTLILVAIGLLAIPVLLRFRIQRS